MARVGLLLVSALAFAMLVQHMQLSPTVVLKLPPGLGWANASAYLLVKNGAYPVLLIPYGYSKARQAVPEASVGGQCSGRVVAVLPYRIGVPLPPPHRVVAKYVYGGRRVVIAPAEIPVPALPYLGAGDKAVYSIYICGNGSACQLVAAYRVSGAKLASPVTVEPAYFSRAVAAVQRGDVWIVERPPMDLSPSSTCETCGIPDWICSGRRCIVSGGFTVPPLAKLYEVWGTVHALAPSRFTAILYVNGAAVATDTVELDAGETLFLGARMMMSTVSGRARYVQLELRIKPIGSVKALYNVHAYVVDEIAVNDPLLYRESINIIGPLGGDKEAKTYIAESGSLRLTLPVPRVFAERLANLTLRIEGSENQPPRRIKVYIANALVCQGVSSRDPATGRQDYRCNVSDPALASTLRRLLETGRSFSIVVELNGSVPPRSWWVVGAPILVTMSRATYSEPDYIALGEPYGEAGYPLDAMWSLGYLFGEEWIQLAPVGHPSTLSAAAELGGTIAGERLSAVKHSSRILVSFWLKKSGGATAGQTESFLMGLDARIVVKYSGVRTGFGDVGVRYVDTRGSVEEALKKKAMEILGAVIKALTEIFESPGGEIAVAGKKTHVLYLVRRFPASFTSGSHVVYTVSKVYRKECGAGGCVEAVEKAVINIRLVPGWFGPTIANTSVINVHIYVLPVPPRMFKPGDAYTVSVAGSARLCSIRPRGVIACVRLPLSGSARFP